MKPVVVKELPMLWCFYSGSRRLLSWPFDRGGFLTLDLTPTVPRWGAPSYPGSLTLDLWTCRLVAFATKPSGKFREPSPQTATHRRLMKPPALYTCMHDQCMGQWLAFIRWYM